MQSHSTGDPIAWGVAVLVAAVTLVVSTLITRSGWKRDQRSRDLEAQGRCLAELSNLLHARSAPLFNRKWEVAQGVSANRFHILATAAMRSVSPEHQDMEIVRFIANQGIAIQDEALRYLASDEADWDYIRGEVGPRRAGIANAVAMIQDELMSWQAGEISSLGVHSFWWHYCDWLLAPASSNRYPKESARNALLRASPAAAGRGVTV